MEHAEIIASNYESIKARAEEIGVPLQWALDQRRQYLTDRMEEAEAGISEQSRNLPVVVSKASVDYR